MSSDGQHNSEEVVPATLIIENPAKQSNAQVLEDLRRRVEGNVYLLVALCLFVGMGWIGFGLMFKELIGRMGSHGPEERPGIMIGVGVLWIAAAFGCGFRVRIAMLATVALALLSLAVLGLMVMMEQLNQPIITWPLAIMFGGVLIQLYRLFVMMHDLKVLSLPPPE